MNDKNNLSHPQKIPSLLEIRDSELMAMAERWDEIAHATEIRLPPWWHPLRRAFMKGRVCCLRESAANLRDKVNFPDI